MKVLDISKKIRKICNENPDWYEKNLLFSEGLISEEEKMEILEQEEILAQEYSDPLEEISDEELANFGFPRKDGISIYHGGYSAWDDELLADYEAKIKEIMEEDWFKEDED